jgi:lysozyme
MKLNENGYKLITSFEGLKLKPYLDSVKIPTIGYGNTYYSDGKRVTMLDKAITQDEAYEMFKEIADRFAKAVDKNVKAKVSQNSFNSMVSLAYNIGTGSFASSTLLKKVNINPNDPTIAHEFSRWNKAGGKVLNGLTNRRLKESNLYFTK